MRKLLAILLSAVMLMPEVYAEPLVNNNISSENEGTEIINDGVITEDPIDEVVTDTEEDETPVVEDTETDVPVVTTPTEETSDETVTEEQNTPVLLADEGVQSPTVPTSPSLTLDEATKCMVTKNDGTSSTDVSVLSYEGDTITVYGGPGLILLSNVTISEYKEKNIILASRGFAGWDVTNIQEFHYSENEQSYSKSLAFLGLGSTDSPFEKQLSIDNAATDMYITTITSLFNAISAGASIPGTLKFWLTSQSHNNPLFAEKVIDGSLTADILLKADPDATELGYIGGIIGTLTGQANVNVKLTIDNPLTKTVENTTVEVPLAISGTGDRGLFCNTMESGSTLKTAISYTHNDAITITSTNGNAGGIVGHANDSTIGLIEGTERLFLTDVTISAGAGKAAGGLIGDYSSQGEVEFNLSKYLLNITFDNSISSNSNINLGGLFGKLSNSGKYTIQGNDSDYSNLTTSEGFRISSKTIDTATGISAYGGLIGTYSAESLSKTLVLQNISVKSQSLDRPNAYGGVIGTLPTTSYVEINNLAVDTRNTASKFGGLVASAGDTSAVLLNVGNVKLSCLYHNISGDNRGGLVGYLANGIIRLHGTTDLSKQWLSNPGSKQGQIVGYNGNGLVYGVGNGEGQYGDGTGIGWRLLRYDLTNNSESNTSTASDIGNWGQVIRLDGVKLKETCDADDDSSLFCFDSTGHTVKVLGSPANTYNIANVRDFTAYSIAYNFNPTQGSISSVLLGTDGVTSSSGQNISIGSSDSKISIDLTGTGVLGIGRDNGGNNPDRVFFSGTIKGVNSPTITIDIGNSIYGKNNSSPSEPIGYGGLQVYNGSHHFLGFLSVAGNSTGGNNQTSISGLTICGNVTAYGDNNTSYKKRMSAVVAYGKKNLKFDNVTVSAVLSAKGNNGTFNQGGFIGDEVDNDSRSSDLLTFENCNWSGTLSNVVRNSYLGGFIGYVQSGLKTINITNCVVSGTIEANNSNWQDVHMGGLIAEFQNGNNTEMAINNLQISNANINATTAKNTCGGLLGYCWPNVNVTFGNGTNSGVTIAGSTLNANNAVFGGLVYQASGYWNATAANSIKFVSGDNPNVFTSKSENNTSGLLIGTGLVQNSSNVTSALYLEVGTWGIEGSAYYISKGAVRVQTDANGTVPTVFDELVGVTINDNAGNDNAVISLATNSHELINQSSCNTYKGQIKNFINDKSRYYYNLDNCRSSGNEKKSTLSPHGLLLPSSVLSWSVSQYAADNIRDYFCSNPDSEAFISADINLNGYSYYPVTPLKSVTVGNDSSYITLSFAYEEMNICETDNKPYNNNNQHYLMQYGLFYDVVNNLTVQKTKISGNVGKNSNDSDASNASGTSGALIYNEAKGNLLSTPRNTPVLSLEYITLEGIKVSGLNRSTNYAPLLINKISDGVTLKVNGLTTGRGYMDNNDTVYAATSLIGEIGSSTATDINLDFSNIALDSRKERTGSDTAVKNNNKYIVEYNTYHTIFTHATLLESFQYASDCSGVYNFNSDDKKVTYGVEISNNGDNGRNPGEQYFYYDTDKYVWDGTDSQPDASSIVEFFSDTKYLRYVYKLEGASNNTDNYHELDINLRIDHLSVGCGTYGDPYQITDGRQLIALADYLSNGRANKWVVQVHNTVLTSQKQDNESYHTNTTQEGHSYYMCDGDEWYKAKENSEGKYIKGNSATTAEVKQIRAYLRNAYYQIQNDIEISRSTYMGIGGDITSGDNANAFSGVIVGKNTNTNSDEPAHYPTVYISSTISGGTSFGGLIRFSQGSVVKDLSVNYSGGTITNGESQKEVKPSSITVTNGAIPSITNNPFFFGGVVGYCIGGDTIIDNVSVIYGNNSLKLTGDKARLIAAGGFVGLVGGAKDSSSNGYEKTGGGVVFRNITVTDKGISTSLLQASLETDVITSGGIKNYFYCNPYVGRVLDGYACYETNSPATDGDTLENTDKNYTIPDINPNAGGLAVTKETDGSFTATVANAQGLWLLSAIVNSGAGAMDNDYLYKEKVSGEIESYNSGKPRNGSYDKVGRSDGSTDLGDELFWGGIVNKNISKVSYLVKTYTNISNGKYNAAKITGGSANRNPICIVFSSPFIDVSLYGNGFRGIGSSFGNGKNTWNNTNELSGHFVYVKGITTVATPSTTTVKLGIDRHDYWDNYDQNGWFARGTGLFTGFSYKTDCKIENLTICGESKLTVFDTDGGIKEYIEKGTKREPYGDITVGGFAGHTVNSTGSFTFDKIRLEGLEVRGGHHCGGAIGLLEKSGGPKNVSFESWSIGKDNSNEGVNISKKTYNDGSSGGLLGWCRNGSVTIKGVGKDSNNWNVDGLTVSTVCISVASSAVGGLVGATDGTNVTIKDVKAKNMSISGTKVKDIAGLVATNKEDNATVTINDCYIYDVKMSGSGSTYIGGVLGHIEKANSITITGFSIAGNSIIYSDNGTLGGVIGYLNNSKSTNVSNVNCLNVTVATSKKEAFIGLLVGNTNGKVFNGYNILADNCIVGYNSTATIDNLDSISNWNSNSSKVGLWIGNSSGTSKLVAVAVNNTTIPKKDIGSGSASIVYADYPATQNNTDKSNSPYVDVNPKSEIPVKDSEETETFTILTGNGVSIYSSTNEVIKEDGTKETITSYRSDAETILDEAKSTSSTNSTKYWKVKDESETNNTFSQLLDNSGNAYITDYFKEEQEGKASPITTNFPILVINNIGSSTDIETPIWNYIAALTNVSSGTEAKNLVSELNVNTYQWNSGSSSFIKQSTSSLNVSGTTITIRDKDTYDNQKNQFTLLDVKYNDPTGSNGNVFHLYVPILVKKVMNASFSVRLLSGTDYRKEAYEGSGIYATAGFEEPITAYIEYNYDRSQNEWQEMLDTGENLLWNYSKILNLAYKSDSTLPQGTKLTLVDRQTKKVYYHTYTASDKMDAFDLSMMTLDGSDDLAKSFSPVPVCDLLDLKVTKSGDNNGKYVETNVENATVKVGNIYYRPATEDDTGIKCDISVGVQFKTDGTANYLQEGEGYYLTIQVPKTDGVSVLNHPLTYSSENMSATGAIAAAIKVSKDDSAKNYLVYDGILQSDLTVSTSKNGNPSLGTIMSDGDNIQISLSSTISLSEKGKEYFKNNGAQELYHQFNIHLKKYNENYVATDVLIGAEGARYTYTVTKADSTELLNRDGTFNNSESMEKLTIGCNSDDAGKIAQYFKDNLEGTLKITATYTLPYPTIGSFFPGKNTDDDPSGISVAADSRVATATTQLPITQNKITGEDGTRYYTQNPSAATMIYNTYDRDDTGDDTRKLGINPSDTTNDLSRTIYTSAVYNYANVDPSILNNARSIKYSMQLFQKQEDGSYGNALEKIDEYLLSVTEMGPADGQGIKTLIKRKDFTQDVTKSDTLNIQITPLTGDEFETKEFTYSNYKVVLTAVLLDSAGNELAGTKASDYIVYTNARIYQRIIDTTN